jgi:hypothetical protein
MFTKVLMLVLLGTGYFTRVRDGNRVHELYRDKHGRVVGGYEQRAKNQWFAAQCIGQLATVELSEKQARQYVEACPAAAIAPKPRHTFVVDLGFVLVDGPIAGFSK